VYLKESMAQRISKRERRMKQLKSREEGFSMGHVKHVKLNEYNALFDPNMRHYFENKHVQRLLYSTGQIDRHGRVIDQAKAKGKLAILDREFREAEKIEERRFKEEMEMRYRVQRKRFEELEKTRKSEILQRLKDDHDLSKEILLTMRGKVANSSPQKQIKNASFFMTAEEEGQY